MKTSLKPKKKMVTEVTFNKIRQLLDLKVPRLAVGEITGFSHATIDRVKSLATYAEYKEHLKEMAAKYSAKANGEPITEAVGTAVVTDMKKKVDEINTQVAVLKAIEFQQQKTNELLEQTNDLLGGVVERLKTRRFF